MALKPGAGQIGTSTNKIPSCLRMEEPGGAQDLEGPLVPVGPLASVYEALSEVAVPAPQLERKSREPRPPIGFRMIGLWGGQQGDQDSV